MGDREVDRLVLLASKDRLELFGVSRLKVRVTEDREVARGAARRRDPVV